MVSFAFNIGSIDQLTGNGKRDLVTVSEKILEYNKMEVNGVKKTSPGLARRREAEQALFLKPVQQGVQAAEVEPEHTVHVQLNYRPGKKYKVAVDGLRIRTKLAEQTTLRLPNAEIIGIMEKGRKVKSLATARVGDAIWMYFGQDEKGREQWVCADNGRKAYVK